jgi:amidase
VAGPLARSAEDLKLLLEICGGPVEPFSKAYSWQLPEVKKKTLNDFRIKFVTDDPLCPVSSEIKPVIDTAIKSFKNAGVQLDEGWPSQINPEEQFRNYAYLLQAYVSGGASDEQLEDLRKQAMAPGNSLEKLRAQAYTDPHKYFKIQESKRLKAREDWQDFFKDYDAFILPVAFVPAFPHIDKPWLLHNPDPANKRFLKTPEGDRDYDDIIFWISFATLTGLPATVFPIGLSTTGLPVGLQIMGPFLEDATPIHLAGKLAEITGGIRHPQGFE